MIIFIVYIIFQLIDINIGLMNRIILIGNGFDFAHGMLTID